MSKGDFTVQGVRDMDATAVIKLVPPFKALTGPHVCKVHMCPYDCRNIYMQAPREWLTSAAGAGAHVGVVRTQDAAHAKVRHLSCVWDTPGDTIRDAPGDTFHVSTHGCR